MNICPPPEKNHPPLHLKRPDNYLRTRLNYCPPVFYQRAVQYTYMVKWVGNRNTLRPPIHCNRGGIACYTRGGGLDIEAGYILYQGCNIPHCITGG